MLTETPMYKMIDTVLDGVASKTKNGIITFAEMENVLEKYINIASRVDIRLVGKAYNIRGTFALLHGKPEYALSSYENAREAFSIANVKVGVAAAWNNIGEVYRKQGRFENALEAYEQAHNITDEIDPENSYSFAACNSGMVYLALGNPLKAIEFMERGLGLNDGSQQWNQEVLRNLLVEVLSHLAKAYALSGNLERANEYLDRASFQAHQMADPQNLAYFYSAKIDVAIVENSKLTHILELFKKCEQQWKRVNADIEIAMLRVRLADFLTVHGENQDAIELYKNAIQIFDECGLEYRKERALNRLKLVSSRVV